jgi:hypothetical protein
MPTTTELTNNYLEEHPSIKDCLKHGIINYSKLSRKISKEIKIEKKTSIEAILIACRRYELKKKKEQILENKIIEILRKSELEIKNKIIVTIINKKINLEKLLDIEKKVRRNGDILYTIEGTKVYTIITSEKYLEDLNNFYEKDIIKLTKNLAIITIKSPKELENTPGVNAYIFSMFGDHQINIVEQMSCWTDTLIVISEEDISVSMNFLNFK